MYVPLWPHCRGEGAGNRPMPLLSPFHVSTISFAFVIFLLTLFCIFKYNIFTPKGVSSICVTCSRYAAINIASHFLEIYSVC